MILKLIDAAEGTKQYECDDLRFPVPGDGTFGEGLYGIRSGHERAMFALGSGVLTAAMNGENVVSLDIKEGFLSFDSDVATLINIR